eukprot:38686_1
MEILSYLLLSLFFVQLSRGLVTIEGGTAFEIGENTCHSDDSCPTYDVCDADDDCLINCNRVGNAEVCQWIKINVAAGTNDITINCVTANCYGVIIETDDQFNSVTLNGGLHCGELITYGTGHVVATSVSQATMISAHGAHESVSITMNYPGLTLSAINARSLLIDGLCGGDCRPVVYTPIAADATTTIKFTSTSSNLNGFYIFSLRGTDNLITYCDGVEGQHCSYPGRVHNIRLYYGKDYANVCDYNEGLCDGASLGDELDDYSVIYADKYLASADFRDRTDNLLVYYYRNLLHELYGPGNADISVFCISGFYSYSGCKGVAFDFSESDNVVISNWVQYSTITGPKDSFTEQGYYSSRSAHNTYHLEDTTTIDFLPLCTTDACAAMTWQVALDSMGWQLQEGTLYVGYNQDLSLQCRNQYAWSCGNLVIHSELDPNCIDSLDSVQWDFEFTAYAVHRTFTVEFTTFDISCTVRSSDTTCWTELAAAPEGDCTMTPDCFTLDEVVAALQGALGGSSAAQSVESVAHLLLDHKGSNDIEDDGFVLNKDTLIVFLFVSNVLTVVGGCIACAFWTKSQSQYAKYDSVRFYESHDENQQLQQKE